MRMNKIDEEILIIKKKIKVLQGRLKFLEENRDDIFEAECYKYNNPKYILNDK